MKQLMWLILVFLLPTSLRAQELEPFINFLRTAPAYMNGHVSFKADSVLYQEGWSIVKIVKNKRIDYSFTEDWLEIRPGDAFFVKYAGLKVKVNTVRWTPKGTETESVLPADFTGLSRKKVSAEVARTIEGLFGEKLKNANRVLKTLRRERSIGGLQRKTLSIVSIFTTGDVGDVFIPNYYGEIGINLLPEKARAFNMYGMRVGIKANDHYRSSIKFNGNTVGIYPYSLKFTSRHGVDINKGKEFKILARLVVTSVDLSRRGMDLKMRLGASEITSAAMWVLQMAARTQNPGASCDRCAESAKLPAFQMMVEKELRKSAVTQIKAVVPQIKNMNVSSAVIESFFVKEQCRQTAISCLQNAKDDAREAKLCDQALRACLR